MKSKKWTVPEDKRPEIEALIESTGAKINRDVKGVKEVWRVKLGGSTITMYNTGTLYATPPQNPNEVLEVFNKIAKILGATLEKPDKDFLIGLDETGKGEVLGHSILSGVIFPSSLIEKMDELLGVADTKKKKSVSYWDDLFRELDQLKEQGFNFIIQKIPPWHVDKYNLNKLMDVTYQRILSDLTRKVELENCRITIDDYGIGATLAAFLKSLEKQGAQIVVEQKADQTYVEARLASVISKRDREKLMEAINKSFSLSGIPVGSGNAGDPVTKKWLEEYKKTGKEWPWFVKRSFKNIRELEGHNGKVKKIDPPIRPELLSNDSRRLFTQGKLSIESMSVNCPKCGTMAKSCELFPYKNVQLMGKCIKCGETMPNLNTTLLYYNGCIMPDSSVIIAGSLSKDLEKGKFFESFTVLLHPKVKEECDKTRGGKSEMSRLADFSSIGRIRLVEASCEDMQLPADDLIVEGARKNNAIIYTRDKTMYATTNSKNMFCLKSV